MTASVLAIKLRWLTITSRGTPVDPEVGIRAAKSFSPRDEASSESAGQGSKLPSIRGKPFFRAQSHCTGLDVQAAFALAFLTIASPEAACVRSSTSTGTHPA